jgi:glycopeptide antibiotics resistance protein
LVLFWGLYLIESNFSLKQILLIIIIFGLIIEILQYILPFGRYFDFVDFIANSVGAIIGAFILLFYKKKLL